MGVFGLTFTTIVSVFVHPTVSVAVTINEVVIGGEAFGLSIVESLRYLPGLHAYL